LTPIECAVVSLVDALMETIPEHRCSIQQVLNFCMATTNSIDVNDQIDAATLQDILSRTLNRKEFLAEDSRYDAMRPAKFTNNVLLQENSQEGGRQIGVKAMISPVSTFKQASPKKPKPVAKLNAKENELTFKF